MILSMLLTIVFGFGVITVATIALLNVAGLRLHDLREVNEKAEDNNDQDKPVFEFVYTSTCARDLRESFGKLPGRLMWGAITAVLGVICLYTFIGSTVDIQEAINTKQATGVQATRSSRDMEHLRPVNIITWVSIAGYVLALLFVAGSISERCYVALRKDVHPRRPKQKGGA